MGPEGKVRSARARAKQAADELARTTQEATQELGALTEDLNRRLNMGKQQARQKVAVKQGQLAVAKQELHRAEQEYARERALEVQQLNQTVHRYPFGHATRVEAERRLASLRAQQTLF